MDKAGIDTSVHLKITQIPMTLNHATTGHKLQGKTIEEDLLVEEWATRNIKNWAYVVLSRVRRIDQLYLKYPIPNDHDEQPDGKMVKMMERLRKTKLCKADSAGIADLRKKIRAENADSPKYSEEAREPARKRKADSPKFSEETRQPARKRRKRSASPSTGNQNQKPGTDVVTNRN